MSLKAPAALLPQKDLSHAMPETSTFSSTTYACTFCSTFPSSSFSGTSAVWRC